MNDSTLQLLAAPLLIALLRTGIVLTFSGLALSVFLRLFRVASATVRRVAYVAVLAQGWLFIQGPFAVPVPKALEAMVTKASQDVIARGTPAISTDEKAESRIVISQSPDTILEGIHGLRPSGPRRNTASAAVRQDQRSDPWYANEWDASTNPDDGFHAHGSAWACPRTSNEFAHPRKAVGVAPELRTLELTGNYASPNGGPFESPSTFPWALALAGVWAAGIVVLVGGAVWNYARVICRMPPLADVDPEWAGEWADLQRQAGIRRAVPLAVAEHAGPVLFRLPRGYRLIVPAAAWRTLERSQRLSILRHELAHIERRDVWKSLAVRVLALPHWINPLVWHCVRRFDECAEWACDEAARRDAPEHVPDYARALLQLVQRAEPVFFATRAAREHGLSHRIRRLLTPVQEKGSAMKTAVLFALVLGISLVNLTRLQTRADDESPKAVNVTVTAAPQVAGSTVTVTATATTAPRASTTPAPAAATTAVVNGSPAVAVSPVAPSATPAVPSAAVTITAVPAAAPTATATSTSTTPTAASVQSAITIVGVTPSVATVAQPAALPAPVDSTIAQPATAPAAASAPIGLPASQDPFVAPARASTPAATRSIPPSATSLPAANPFGVRGAVASTPPSWGLPVADPTAKATLFNTPLEPRQARADLGSIMKNLTEYRVLQERHQADFQAWRQLRASEWQATARAVRERIAEEKNPLIKDFLERGIAQKSLEMAQETNPKLAAKAKEIRSQMLAKIVAEIGSYAQEHHLLVVRRADFVRQTEAYLDYSATVATGTPKAALDVGPAPEPGMRGVKINGFDSNPEKLYSVYLSADAPANSWDQEVLYVAGRDNKQEVDISNEIVKRLNAAYAASKSVGGKKTDITQIFSFYVGLTR